MEAFENIDDLFRGLQHFLNPYTIYIAIFALLCFAGAIVFFCIYRSWKSAWETDWKYFDDRHETTHKQHNADLADLRTIIKTWETSFSQLQERYHNSCDKGVEQLNQIDDLRDQLAKSANRVALTEGKLRSKSSKEKAMELTVALLCDAESEDLPGLVDAMWKVIHKNIVQQ